MRLTKVKDMEKNLTDAEKFKSTWINAGVVEAGSISCPSTV